MKLAFSSNAFRRYSLSDAIGILSLIGYSGIEIMADVPHAYPLYMTNKELSRITSSLKRHKMAVSNINAFMLHAEGDTYHPSWIEKDPAKRSKRIKHTLNCIDLAERLGATTISTEPGGPLEDMDFDEGLRLFKQGLLEVEDAARKGGVKILIEPEPGLLIENSRQFLSLYNELDRNVFGLNFDIGHFFCVNEDCPFPINKLKDMTHHFHLEDIARSREHYHLMPGDGAIDIQGVLRTIKDTGYKGFVTVELYTYEQDPIDAAYKALNYINALAI
ncbi:MAG: sugar phosphate isomerase/epimerase [Deltaproteobacteria bacterium]|nr:sugar phosphate isomerase/epimerase [Deltaproteobacteria bacterium]